jgi:hypothetical protein
MTSSPDSNRIEVVARFDQDGNLTPLSFTWHGRCYKIDATGRQWQDEKGDHFLVMVPGEQFFELSFSPIEMRWRIKPSGHSWV